MDNDGPQPRIKNKTVQKRRNGADLFRYEQQRDLDSYDERVDDVVKRARRHNRAVPKLYDELNKREAITTITTINLKDVNCDFNPKCSACAKLITLNELQRLNVKPRCKSGKHEHQEKKSIPEKSSNCDEKKVLEKQSRHKKKLTGIKKQKERKLQPITGIKKHFTSRSSCILQRCVDVHKHNKSASTLRTTKSSQEENVHDVDFAEIVSKDQVEEQSGANSNSGTNSKNHSVSSYNSFLSMEHEPMDNN